MSDIAVDVQSAPTTPAAGQAVLYVDSVTKLLSWKNDAGAELAVPLTKFNQSVAAQGAGFAADTYLTGSNILIPGGFPRVGTRYTLSFDVAKTGAGVVAPVIIVRFGTAGAIGDLARLTFTFPAQTAIADVGRFEVEVVFRAVGSGSSGVMQGRASLIHKGTATGLTGFSVEPGPVVQVTSGGFDTTPANSYIGVSVNGGTSAAWTCQMVLAELTSF